MRARHAAIAGWLRRACSAIIAIAASRSPASHRRVGRLYNRLDTAATSRRAQRAAVRQLPLLASARYGVTSRSAGAFAMRHRADGRSTQRAALGGGACAARCVEARDYTPRHVRAPDRRSSSAFRSFRRSIPPRWEVGHVGWFQEFWCRRYAPRRSARRAHAVAPSACRCAGSTRARVAARHALGPAAAGLGRHPTPIWPPRSTTRSTRSIASRDGERYFFELALYHEDMHGEALLMTLQTLGLPAPPRTRRRAPDARHRPTRRCRRARRHVAHGAARGDDARPLRVRQREVALTTSTSRRSPLRAAA